MDDKDITLRTILDHMRGLEEWLKPAKGDFRIDYAHDDDRPCNDRLARRRRAAAFDG